MPGGQDIRSLLNNVVNFIKSRANHVCTASCDGLVLRMHYRWTFWMLLAGFFTTWYSWYHRDVITCVSHFNAETQVRLDYINICLSYPYIELEPERKTQEEEGEDKKDDEEEEEAERRYLLFYRWISWSFLLMAAVYYIPRKVSKNFDNKKCRKLLEDLAANSHVYDHGESKLVEVAVRYLLYNLRTHDGLYWKYLIVNVVALFVDIFVLHFFDFVLQGRFIAYGIKSYPFDRDPQTFSDYMSQTFPPFVSCELSAENQLVNKRNEKFGCHLTIMELYEKIFLALWLWLIVLTFLTCCYILFLLLLWLPLTRVTLLRFSRPLHSSDGTLQVLTGVLSNCKIGDIYLLYRLKQHFSHARYYELMKRVSSAELNRRATGSDQQPPPSTTLHSQVPANQLDVVSNRRSKVTLEPNHNPELLQQLLNNPEIPLGFQGVPMPKNTRILVD